MLRGSFGDNGLAQLVGLDGLFALDLDSNELAVTGAGLAPLVNLPHLGWLGFDAKDSPRVGRDRDARTAASHPTGAGDRSNPRRSASPRARPSDRPIRAPRRR